MDGEWLQAKILLTSIWIWKDHGTKELELKASFTACVACTMYSLILMPIVSHHDLPKCFCSLCLLENHTIIWIISVRGVLYRPFTPTPCTKQGHLQLSQFAQISIQPDLGCFQGWVIHHPSGQGLWKVFLARILCFTSVKLKLFIIYKEKSSSQPFHGVARNGSPPASPPFCFLPKLGEMPECVYTYEHMFRQWGCIHPGSQTELS